MPEPLDARHLAELTARSLVAQMLLTEATLLHIDRAARAAAALRDHADYAEQAADTPAEIVNEITSTRAVADWIEQSVAPFREDMLNWEGFRDLLTQIANG